MNRALSADYLKQQRTKSQSITVVLAQMALLTSSVDHLANLLFGNFGEYDNYLPFAVLGDPNA